ncbi:MAG TPA: SDR family oxidoreductase [Acidimicrobiia bacterium]|nr:SDR family oxidoreductase [Acidimicrobiia bacterium]
MSLPLEGTRALVTGGNSGIGKETAVALAGMGAQVAIASRNTVKGENARREIKERAGTDVEVLSLDLASFASVRACAEHYTATHDRLDMLVNNAGIIVRERRVTEDGHEMQFQVNHLGHFLLTSLLRDLLVASAPARVVATASDAHRFVRRGIRFDDLEWEQRRYGIGFACYSTTKLMNILFTRELARTLDATGVTANAVHPGFVASNFAREGDTGRLGNAAMVLGRPFAISNEKGARTSVFVASSPTLNGVTGQYFAKSRFANPTRKARDDDTAARLWAISAELTDTG